MRFWVPIRIRGWGLTGAWMCSVSGCPNVLRGFLVGLKCRWLRSACRRGVRSRYAFGGKELRVSAGCHQKRLRNVWFRAWRWMWPPRGWRRMPKWRRVPKWCRVPKRWSRKDAGRARGIVVGVVCRYRRKMRVCRRHRWNLCVLRNLSCRRRVMKTDVW